MLLEEYQCTIPTSAVVQAFLKKNYVGTEQFPVVKVSMNFVQGKFRLDGDWEYLIAANKNNEPVFSPYQRERVKIETDIYPSLAIDLDDSDSDGLLFSLQGTIVDNNAISSCSGLLVFDNVRDGSGGIGDQWNISFYLYDHRFDDCEISFRLCVYVDGNRSHKN